MGQKVHPYGFRLGVIRGAKSKWFAEGRQFRQWLIEDLKLRNYIVKNHQNASIADVQIERAADLVTVTVTTAKPGIIIGKGGRDVEALRNRLEAMVGQRVRVNVDEAKEPDTNAQLVAENIARQIERRVSYRRAMKQAVDRAMRLGAGGIRAAVSGRLGGAEIARTESIAPEGRVPLHTLRADVEYGVAEAQTGYGNIGVRVWIYKGEILPPRKQQADLRAVETVEAAAAALGTDAPTASPAGTPAAVPGVPESVVSEAAPAVAPTHLTAAPARVEAVKLDKPEDDLLIAALEDEAEASTESGETEE
jgi:small subunit ribosomal protein S3